MFSIKKNHLTVLGVSLIAISLGACASPNAIPSGYTHHNKEFKSANPPASKKVSKEARKYMGPEQAEQFRYAVYDLVTKLTDRAGLPPRGTYVLQPSPMTPFYGNLDNDVRESLRHTGYQLADTPEGAYIITYVATLIKKPEAMAGQAAPTTDANVTIGLYVYDSVGPDARMLTEQTGNYYIQGAEALHVPYAKYPGVPTPLEAKKKQTMPEPQPTNEFMPMTAAPAPAPAPAPSTPARVSPEMPVDDMSMGQPMSSPSPAEDPFTPAPYDSANESYQSYDEMPTSGMDDGLRPPFYSQRPRVSKQIDLDE